jgi:hypothetical protein
MKNRRYFPNLCTCLFLWAYLLCIPGYADALEYDFSGQLSGWYVVAENSGDPEHSAGLRYIPRIGFRYDISGDVFFDAEVSVNGVATLNTDNTADDADLDVYRLKIRLATNQMETRLGLQKISFGPAFLLRSLQWFDRLDPRDPQKLTDGVYGIRFKYSALNNAGYWIWVLLGNDDLKGFEILPTDANKPEVGGRIQYPVAAGELAATFHTRKVDLPLFFLPDITERRYALDGRWDMVVGFWFEAVAQQYDTDLLPFEWIKLTTIGVDYTFGIGNGLYVLGEHLTTTLSGELSQWTENRHFSAYSVRYPIGFSDAVSVIGYYDWDENDAALYAGWERTYDNLAVTASVFTYPETDETLFGFRQNAGAKGSGGQVVFVYHH